VISHIIPYCLDDNGAGQPNVSVDTGELIGSPIPNWVYKTLKWSNYHLRGLIVPGIPCRTKRRKLSRKTCPVPPG
jgi:hypothetical protein